MKKSLFVILLVLMTLCIFVGCDHNGSWNIDLTKTTLERVEMIFPGEQESDPKTVITGTYSYNSDTGKWNRKNVEFGGESLPTTDDFDTEPEVGKFYIMTVNLLSPKYFYYCECPGDFEIDTFEFSIVDNTETPSKTYKYTAPVGSSWNSFANSSYNTDLVFEIVVGNPYNAQWNDKDISSSSESQVNVKKGDKITSGGTYYIILAAD